MAMANMLAHLGCSNPARVSLIQDQGLDSIDTMKESNLIETAEFAVANKIHTEPAFAWWVPFMIKKRNRISAKVKSKYWLCTHKFGIRVPKSVEEALRLDKENRDNLLWESICKENEECPGCLRRV